MASKSCNSCKVEKDLSLFYVQRRGNRLIADACCKECRKGIGKKRRNRAVAWLDEIKKHLECEHCGFSDYRALEFHHVRGEKTKGIAIMVIQGHGREAVLEEIEKCICLCANCHVIAHNQSLDFAHMSSPSEFIEGPTDTIIPDQWVKLAEARDAEDIEIIEEDAVTAQRLYLDAVSKGIVPPPSEKSTEISEPLAA